MLLQALPVSLIEFQDGVILKRGCAEFRVSGSGAVDVVRAIVEFASGDGCAREEIIESFAGPDRPAISALIQELEDRRFLVQPGADGPTEGRESNLEVFYWDFGQTEKSVTSRLNEQKVAVLGVNHISRQIASSLRATGFTNFQVVDQPLLRNLRLFSDQQHLDAASWNPFAPEPVDAGRWEEEFGAGSWNCVIATSDFGGATAMREWNEFCVKRKIHFLPVVLQNMVGYVGPFVVPGETPCFECLRARQNSNMQEPELQRAPEGQAFAGQGVIGFHPSMASILGDLAAVEVSKFYGGWMPAQSVGSVIVARMLVPSVTIHKVLKIPRCSVCSSLNRQSSIVIEKGLYMPGNKQES
jgi:bacteriocin biosynthesis cyclodehydratase domain-containing protein